MSEYEKTTSPNLVIDKSTGAVLNSDMGAYEAIKKARMEKKKNIELGERVTALEQEVKLLRAMITGQG